MEMTGSSRGVRSAIKYGDALLTVGGGEGVERARDDDGDGMGSDGMVHGAYEFLWLGRGRCWTSRRRCGSKAVVGGFRHWGCIGASLHEGEKRCEG